MTDAPRLVDQREAARRVCPWCAQGWRRDGAIHPVPVNQVGGITGLRCDADEIWALPPVDAVPRSEIKHAKACIAIAAAGAREMESLAQAHGLDGALAVLEQLFPEPPSRPSGSPTEGDR